MDNNIVENITKNILAEIKQSDKILSKEEIEEKINDKLNSVFDNLDNNDDFDNNNLDFLNINQQSENDNSNEILNENNESNDEYYLLEETKHVDNKQTKNNKDSFLKDVKSLYKTELNDFIENIKNMFFCFKKFKNCSFFEFIFILLLVIIPLFFGISILFLLFLFLFLFWQLFLIIKILSKYFKKKATSIKKTIRIIKKKIKKFKKTGGFFKRIFFSNFLYSIIVINGIFYLIFKNLSIALNSINNINKIISNISAKIAKSISNICTFPSKLILGDFGNKKINQQISSLIKQSVKNKELTKNKKQIKNTKEKNIKKIKKAVKEKTKNNLKNQILKKIINDINQNNTLKILDNFINTKNNLKIDQKYTEQKYNNFNKINSSSMRLDNNKIDKNAKDNSKTLLNKNSEIYLNSKQSISTSKETNSTSKATNSTSKATNINTNNNIEKEIPNNLTKQQTGENQEKEPILTQKKEALSKEEINKISEIYNDGEKSLVDTLKQMYQTDITKIDREKIIAAAKNIANENVEKMCNRHKDLTKESVDQMFNRNENKGDHRYFGEEYKTTGENTEEKLLNISKNINKLEDNIKTGNFTEKDALKLKDMYEKLAILERKSELEHNKNTNKSDDSQENKSHVTMLMEKEKEGVTTSRIT